MCSTYTLILAKRPRSDLAKSWGFFCEEEKYMTWWKSLKPPHLFQGPYFDPMTPPVPFRGVGVTELDLNSPWEGPRSGFYCTPASFDVHTCSTSSWGPSGPRHKDPSSPRPGKFTCATREVSSGSYCQFFSFGVPIVDWMAVSGKKITHFHTSLSKRLKIFFNLLKGFYPSYLVLKFGNILPTSNRDMAQNMISQRSWPWSRS